jgi:hypothetical protein
VCFACENDDDPASVLNDLGRRRVPIILFVARQASGSAQTDARLVEDILLGSYRRSDRSWTLSSQNSITDPALSVG